MRRSRAAKNGRFRLSPPSCCSVATDSLLKRCFSACLGTNCRPSFFGRERDDDQRWFGMGTARFETLRTALEVVKERDLQGSPFARKEHPTRYFICRFNRGN